MSAREQLAEQLRNPGLVGLDEEDVAELINAFAHELAEQQRAHANSVDGEPGCWHDGASAVADLIDPHKSAGPVRLGEEPT